jgi:peptidoglycan/xylan/chitin deacetylase (PgdA/CDA1 family)
MPQPAAIYLMYHELKLEARPLCQNEQGYARYVVREPAFRQQMNWLKSEGIRGLSVSEGLQSGSGIVLTFDDGCETDLISAAPILREMNCSATFYITVGFLGRPGYMVEKQIRELSDAGFEIGCHSMTHPYLDELNDQELSREIVEAKRRLEDMTGRQVEHFSCPGGRWTPEVAEVARSAGYRSVTTSRVGVNYPASDLFQLSRIAVMRDFQLPAFQAICRGQGIWQRQLRERLQTAAHKVLGNAVYDRVRGLILERKS